MSDLVALLKSPEKTRLRFMDKVDQTPGLGPKGECWLWTGATDPYGYGNFGWRGHSHVKAHRAAFLLFVGNIPAGLFVCHDCDTPGCVRPAHLFLGSHEANMADMSRKDRRPRGDADVNHKITDAGIKQALQMRAAGQSQEVVAAQFGISGQHLSKIERGLARTRPATRRR